MNESCLTQAELRSLMDIVAGELGVSLGQVTEEARIREDLGADSLDVVEISMAVEERFGMAVPDESVERIRTFGDLVREVSQVKGQQANGRAPRESTC